MAQTTQRGFGAMGAEKLKTIASRGGKTRGVERNPGNFGNNPVRASMAGQKAGGFPKNADMPMC
jgi:general stress protein YciG